MNNLEVMMPGSPCQIGPHQDKIKGRILEVCVRDKNCISYKVSWWDGRSRKTEWLEQIEVSRVDETLGIKIGFVSHE